MGIQTAAVLYLATHKKCCRCKAVQPLDAFAKRAKSKDGKQQRCRACSSMLARLRNGARWAADREDARRTLIQQMADGVRTCYKCKETKPLDHFHRAADGLGGKRACCKDCSNIAHRRLRGCRTDEQRAAMREECRHNAIYFRYKLRPEAYKALLAAQNNVCAICHGPEVVIDPRNNHLRSLCVDHDHKCCPGIRSCGKCIRGLLCSACNQIVGLVEAYPERFPAAADYIGKNKCP